jgi:hypothetical protein
MIIHSEEIFTLYDCLKYIDSKELIHIGGYDRLGSYYDIWVGYVWQFIKGATFENTEVLSIKSNQGRITILIDKYFDNFGNVKRCKKYGLKYED